MWSEDWGSAEGHIIGAVIKPQTVKILGANFSNYYKTFAKYPVWDLSADVLTLGHLLPRAPGQERE